MLGWGPVAVVLCWCHTTLVRGTGLCSSEAPVGILHLVGPGWLRVVGAGGKEVSGKVPRDRRCPCTGECCVELLEGTWGQGHLEQLEMWWQCWGSPPSPWLLCFGVSKPWHHPWRWIWIRGAFLLHPAGRNVLAAARCLVSPAWHPSHPGHAGNATSVGPETGCQGVCPPQLSVMLWGCILHPTPRGASSSCPSPLPDADHLPAPGAGSGPLGGPHPRAPIPAGCRNACAWKAMPGSGCLGTG